MPLTRGQWACVAAGAILLIAAIAAAIAASDGTPSTVDSVTVPASSPTDERLPDLDQEEPSDLEIRTVPTETGTVSHRIGFRSAVRNIGVGPLIVEGSRPDTSTPTMTVSQLIERPDAAARRIVPDVGRMEYAISPDHSHWHYLQFERYELQRFELRRADGDQAIVADRKTGFCLGDRYRAAVPQLPFAPPDKVFTSRCGLMQPELLSMREGISVGYGDDYSAFLEGQELPLDGLADGRYVLVHRVNIDEQLAETSYVNNASSLLFELRWQNGTPSVQSVAVCPDSDRCS